MKSLSAEVTTVSASVATCSSVYSTPPFLQAAASSSSIGREASEMSVWPWQNFSNPPPVPAVPTETLTSGDSSLKTSPADDVSGSTGGGSSSTGAERALVTRLTSGGRGPWLGRRQAFDGGDPSLDVVQDDRASLVEP